MLAFPGGERLGATEELSTCLTLIARHRLVVVLGPAVAFLPIEARRRVRVVDAGRVRAPWAGALHGRTVAVPRGSEKEAVIPCGLTISGNARG